MTTASTFCDLKTKLKLVEICHILASEGVTRASVSEIVERIQSEGGSEIGVSTAGQLISSLGLRKVASHGRSRLVLDEAELSGLLEQLRKEVEEAEQAFGLKEESLIDLRTRAFDLEQRHSEAEELSRKERMLRSRIAGYGDLKQEIQMLEYEESQLLEQSKEVDRLQKQCEELQRKVGTLPDLKERAKELRKSIREAESKEREIINEEKVLEETISKLRQRRGWVDLARLTEEIDAARAELEALREQLGEKRSLLSRMFGRSSS